MLATKLYGAMGEWPNEGRLSALNIRRACDASLRRLRTGYIDLYQMHHVDRDTPWDEIWQAMEVLVAQGKILYAGSSNFAGWHIAQANGAAAARNFFGLVSEQSIYNLMTRDIELEVLPAWRRHPPGSRLILTLEVVGPMFVGVRLRMWRSSTQLVTRAWIIKQCSFDAFPGKTVYGAIRAEFRQP